MELRPIEDFQMTLMNLADAGNAAKSCLDDEVPDFIQQGLYLGSVSDAANKSLLKEFKITHILTIANSAPPLFPQDFTYKVISVTDSEHTNLAQYFDECVDFIDEAIRRGGAVLVHCIFGVSRSATIVAAYLMKKHRMSSAAALQFVRKRRPLIRPNSGFRTQLRNFERSLIVQDKLSSATSANGVEDQQSSSQAGASCSSSSYSPLPPYLVDADRGFAVPDEKCKSHTRRRSDQQAAEE